MEWLCNSSIKFSLSTPWIPDSKIPQLLRGNMEWCSSRFKISVFLNPLQMQRSGISLYLLVTSKIVPYEILLRLQTFFFTSIHRSKFVHSASVHMPAWHNTSALPTLIPIKRSCCSYSAMAVHGKVRNRSCLLSVDTHLCFYACILCTNILFVFSFFFRNLDCTLCHKVELVDTQKHLNNVHIISTKVSRFIWFKFEVENKRMQI